MGTQLILTVGKNPLPVWVAWDRLTAHWRAKGHRRYRCAICVYGRDARRKRIAEGVL